MKVMEILAAYEQGPGYKARCFNSFEPEKTLTRVIQSGIQVGWDSKSSSVEVSDEVYESSIQPRLITYDNDSSIDNLLFEKLSTTKMSMTDEIDHSKDHVFAYTGSIRPDRKFVFVPAGSDDLKDVPEEKPDAVYTVEEKKFSVYSVDSDMFVEADINEQHRQGVQGAMERYHRKDPQVKGLNGWEQDEAGKQGKQGKPVQLKLF
ncbi:MAG: hypothetical protein R6U32_01695 [Candidatus Woesearchaeota archaeon]